MPNTPQREKNQVDYDKYFGLCSIKPKVKRASDGTYRYYGFAYPGSSTADAVWRIVRKTISSKDIDHADGDLEFDNVWDNYASLSYS